MRGDRRSRPISDGGIDHAALFESFPDPLLAYGGDPEADESGGGREGGDASPPFVVREVNAAFESAFGLGTDEVAGTPLDRVVLTGTVTSDREDDDATAGPDPAEAGAENGADAGTAAAADPSATTTAGSILDRLRATGTGVRFRRGTEGETRRFRVRAVTAGTDDERGYLLFTDVTELERRRRDLAGRVAHLERLASVARHDVRNPLEVAEIRLEAARDTGEDVHFEKVASALDRIQQIVREVLAVGGGGVDPTDAIALDDVAEAAWETVDTADATLVVSEGLPTVRGDADRLRQLFENLFRNAVEHGGPVLTVRVEPVPDGFAVADDGPGFPEGVRERAFEAGFSTAPDNSGLGLAIVRQIAREHGWRVTLATGQTAPADADRGARVEFVGVERVGDGDDPGGSGNSAGSDEPNDAR